MLTGYSANLPNDAVLDMGVVYVGSTKIGVTRGPAKFDPNTEYMNIEFDGKHAPIKGLDRVFHGEPTLSFTLIEAGDSSTGGQIEKLIPGNTSASAGVTPNQVKTFTPKVGGGFIASGDYLANVRVVYERAALTGAKQYAAILIPVAFVRKWDLQGRADGERTALINVEIVGRKDMASGTTADAAYQIELRESTP